MGTGCPKVPGARSAYGYWGRNPYGRVQAEETPQRIRALLQDKLVTRGQRVYLYEPVLSGPACTCTKDTNTVSDRPCPECYGTGFLPGFTRFQHADVFFGASQFESATLTNVESVVEFKPNPLTLISGIASGTIETPLQSYANPNAEDWTTHVDSYVRSAGESVDVEFTLDGVTYTPLSDINGPNKPVGTGNLGFRVTLTRTSTGGRRGPYFQMVRARHVESQFVQRVGNPRNDVLPGEILILRPWVQEQAQSDTGRGILVEWLGDRSWTAPLDFFDTRPTPNEPPARIDDRAPGPHPFIEHIGTIKEGNRVVLSSFKYNEELGIFTHQAFDERRAQTEEFAYGAVF